MLSMQWRVRPLRRLAMLGLLGARPRPFAGIVTLQPDGCWRLDPGPGETLCLERAWPCGAWTALRFSATAAERKLVDVALWRPALSDSAWRALHRQLARQASLSMRAVTKETQ